MITLPLLLLWMIMISRMRDGQLINTIWENLVGKSMALLRGL